MYVYISLLHGPLDTNGKIFGHESSLDRGNTSSFQSFGKLLELLIAVQFRPVEESTCPREDGCDRIR